MHFAQQREIDELGERRASWQLQRLRDREIYVLAHHFVDYTAWILSIDGFNADIRGAFDHVLRMAEFGLSNFVSFLFASEHELQAFHHDSCPTFEFVAA